MFIKYDAFKKILAASPRHRYCYKRVKRVRYYLFRLREIKVFR
jgi:hypothetical protein